MMLARKYQRDTTKVLLGRRFTEHAAIDPSSVRGLPAEHPAIAEARTLFPSRRVRAADSDRLLISGINQRKIGGWIEKGAWSGMPVFTLTLEERATCPRSCHHWADCYGNAMPWPRRHIAGPDLIERLGVELMCKQAAYPRGFAVRLHILGDFFSVAYVETWRQWLNEYPALHVFGFTAWPAKTAIGDAVAALRDERWNRFALRTSGRETGPTRAVTIDRVPEAPRVPEGIVCPAQSERTAACGTCGLCWAPSAKDEAIVFVKHGAKSRGPKLPVAA